MTGMIYDAAIQKSINMTAGLYRQLTPMLDLRVVPNVIARGGSLFAA
jgi:hypothetical protein